MAVGDIKALGYRVYEAINARDIVALEDVFDPDVIRHAAGEKGIESVRIAVSSLGDRYFVVEDLFAEDNKIALRVTVHKQGSAVSEKPLSTIMEIFRVENGRVAEVWGAGLVHQAD